MRKQKRIRARLRKIAAKARKLEVSLHRLERSCMDDDVDSTLAHYVSTACVYAEKVREMVEDDTA